MSFEIGGFQQTHLTCFAPGQVGSTSSRRRTSRRVAAAGQASPSRSNVSYMPSFHRAESPSKLEAAALNA